MGYDLQKRLALLQEQVEQAKYRSFRFSRLLFYAFIAISLFIFIIVNPLTALETDPQIISRSSDKHSHITTFNSSIQREPSSLELVTIDRIKFLDGWFWGADFYQRFSHRVISAFFLPPSIILTSQSATEINPFDYIEPAQLNQGLTARTISLLLRSLFVLVAFFPLWITAIIIGLLLIRRLRNQRLFDPILSVCDRGRSIFYSGIYGAFRLNNSFSGTDFASPGLACPNKTQLNQVLNHSLVRILKNSGAFCQTSLELVQIILAYNDFPCTVDDEKPVEEETDVSRKGKFNATSDTGLTTNEEGTIEKNALELLPGLLSCHRIMRSYFRSMKKSSPAEVNYNDYRQFIQRVLPKCTPLVKLLLDLITPRRAYALSTLPPTAIASAYLSLEAGKSMIYKKIGKGFVKVSQFPHLQARAVLHSITKFHEEFDGDTRLIMRQAILCSRRHGDFARSFLPENMPLAARALRDLLEVLYAAPNRRQDIAIVTELDAQIEEIMHNWRDMLVKHLATYSQLPHSNATRKQSFSSDAPYLPEKGLVFKSVVLLPQDIIIQLALNGLSPERLIHISQLIGETRRFAKLLAVSARLPGFQRQVEKLEEFTSRSVPNAAQEELSLEDKWLIVHRMFTRYNWLSTRVGDDGVPENGIVYSVVIIPSTGTDKPQIVGATNMVPLRQRRYRELFGLNWERDFYADSIHPNNIEVFVENELYQQDMTRKEELAKKGLLNLTTNNDTVADKPAGSNG